MAEIIQLKDDGTAVLNLATGRVVLRRPRVGEVRAVQDATIEAGDAGVDAAEEVRERLAEKAAEMGIDTTDPTSEAAGKVLAGWVVLAQGMGDDAEARTASISEWVQEALNGAEAGDGEDVDASVARDWRRAQRDENRRINRETQAAWFDVGRLVVKTLATKGGDALPDDDDDLDPMLGQSALYVDLLKHWTTRPLSDPVG